MLEPYDTLSSLLSELMGVVNFIFSTEEVAEDFPLGSIWLNTVVKLTEDEDNKGVHASCIVEPFIQSKSLPEYDLSIW